MIIFLTSLKEDLSISRLVPAPRSLSEKPECFVPLKAISFERGDFGKSEEDDPEIDVFEFESDPEF